MILATLFAEYAGLFAAAVVAATILPAQSEILLGAMLVSERFDATLLLAAMQGRSLPNSPSYYCQISAEFLADRQSRPVLSNVIGRIVRDRAPYSLTLQDQARALR